MDEMSSQQQEQEISKSRVRVRVTYAMSASYIFASLGLIGWLMYVGKHEMALGVFSGLASTKAAIIAFWFGSRGSTRTQSDDGS